ncbi:MAG: hypothetical protein H7X92_13730 [Chitinophagales bacterium]|nr:hypothetical protein [Hyphomicrobiales bacterium]
MRIVGIAPQAGLDIDSNRLPHAVQSASGKTLQRAPSENLAGYMARNLTGANVNGISGSPFQNDVSYRGFRASPARCRACRTTSTGCASTSRSATLSTGASRGRHRQRAAGARPPRPLLAGLRYRF